LGYRLISEPIKYCGEGQREMLIDKAGKNPFELGMGVSHPNHIAEDGEGGFLKGNSKYYQEEEEYWTAKKAANDY
jgi:hypothetical protein